MRKAQTIRLLQAIHNLALLAYPFPDEAMDNDSYLALALAEIAGIAARTVHLAQQRRPAREVRRRP
jgi:hypothetical protein